MSIQCRVRFAIAVIFPILLGAMFGCSGSDPNKLPKVELSSVEAVALSAKAVKVSVHYKFIEGRPRAGQYYICSLKPNQNADVLPRGFNIWEGDGSELSREGDLHGELDLGRNPLYESKSSPLRPARPGTTVAYQVTLIEGLAPEKQPKERQTFLVVSNTAQGQFQIVQQP